MQQGGKLWRAGARDIDRPVEERRFPFIVNAACVLRGGRCTPRAYECAGEHRAGDKSRERRACAHLGIKEKCTYVNYRALRTAVSDRCLRSVTAFYRETPRGYIRKLSLFVGVDKRKRERGLLRAASKSPSPIECGVFHR